MMLTVPIIFLPAQNGNVIGWHHNLEVEFTTLRSPKPDHSKNYPENLGTLTYFEPTISFEGRLKYNWYINNGIGLNLGLRLGSYPFTMRSFAKEEFTQAGIDIDFFPGRFGVMYGGPYTGVLGGIQYNIALGKNLKIASKAGIWLMYFIPYELTVSYVVPSFHPRTLFSSQIIYNREQKILCVPEFSVSIYRQIGRRFCLTLNGYYACSRNTILNGQYQLFGHTETLAGTFSKHFAYTGIGIGLMVLSKINK